MELECPRCHGLKFREERGVIHSMYEMHDFVMAIKICKECKYVMLFSEDTH